MPNVVVLLPEGQRFDQLFTEALAPAAAEAHWTLTRPSCEFSRPGRLGELGAALESASLVVAEVTGRNPNVMYLAGYCHGTGRKVLLLASWLEDFCFDKSRHPVIGYAGDHAFLKAELARFLATGSLSAAEPAPASSARERFLELFGDILAAHHYEHRGGVELENPTTFILLEQEMGLALVQDLARKARDLGLRLKLM